jgi:hypothetical protein
VIKHSIKLNKLKGYESVKDCYYYNSIEKAIYTTEPRSNDLAVERIESPVLRSTDNKTIRVDVSELEQLMKEYCKGVA